MSHKTPISQDILDNEFVLWMESFGRNKNDLGIRFGEYIWSTYKMPCFGHVGDGFSEDVPEEAYNILTRIIAGDHVFGSPS